ncbi:MAG: hypothetical protein QOI98_658 [Solirubrobacteraceae bacterium]|nr:hypothetical protein [Solirubrobacteraceae bacterium]
MTTRHLHDLLDGLDDTREVVIDERVPLAMRVSELFAMWSAARAEANDAYERWRVTRGQTSFSVYRAAEDRADAAEAALALSTPRR